MKPCHFVAVEVQLLLLLTYLVFQLVGAHCMLTRTYRIFFLFLVFYFASFFFVCIFLALSAFCSHSHRCCCNCNCLCCCLGTLRLPAGRTKFGSLYNLLTEQSVSHRSCSLLFASLLQFCIFSVYSALCLCTLSFKPHPLFTYKHTHRYTSIRMCAVVSAYLAYHMFVGM